MAEEAKSPITSPARASTPPSVLLIALLASSLSLVVGLCSLARWVQTGFVPHARSWLAPAPLCALAVLALIIAASYRRRVSAPEWTLGFCAWALAVRVCRELPGAASAQHLNDGPLLIPVYLALGLAAGLFAAAGPRNLSPQLRSSALLVFACTGNVQLFDRSNGPAFSIIACLALVLFAAHAGRYRELIGARRGGRLMALCAAALLTWLLAAALGGDSIGRGISLWMRVLLGAVIALALAGSLCRREAAQTYHAMLAGIAASLLLLAVGLFETSRVYPWELTLHTRLRLFDSHSNVIGPLFGAGLSLCLAPLLLGGVKRGRSRSLLSLLALSCGIALWRTESLAAWVGSAAGVAALALVRFSLLPRKALAWAGALLLAGAAGIAILLSPAGEPARDWLEAKTWEQSAVGQRWHFWRMSAATVREHPWLGSGPGQYYAHAQHAQPSFYDGTPQDLHPHNIFLAFAESGGLPAMLLFALLSVGALDVLRRATLRSSMDSDAYVPAGLLAALCALLTSNLFDLGQSQTTLVPLLFWIALGLGSTHLLPAQAPTGPHARTPRLLALGLIFPLAWMPAAGTLLSERAIPLFKAGKDGSDPAAAMACLDWALLLNPFESLPHRHKATIYRKRGELEGRPELIGASLEELRLDCMSAPSRGRTWLNLAWNALELGRGDVVSDALERAAHLDPLGDQRSKLSYAHAWLALLSQDLSAARAHLLAGLRRPGNQWDQLPHIELPALEGDPPEARRIAFVTPRDARRLPFEELLLELEREALELVESEPLQAYRTIGRVVESLQSLGLSRAALEVVDRYTARVADHPGGLDVLAIRLCADLGEVERGRAIAESSLVAGDLFFATQLALMLTRRGEPQDLVEAEEMLDRVREIGDRDLFFDAKQRQKVGEAKLEILLALRRYEPAHAVFLQAQFNRGDPQARVFASHRFLKQVLLTAPPAEAILRALDQLLHDLSRVIGFGASKALQRARMVVNAWPGKEAEALETLRRELGSHGAAGAAFRDALDELEAAR